MLEKSGYFKPVLSLYFVIFTGSIYSLFTKFNAAGALSEKAGESSLYLGLLLLAYAGTLYQLTRAWPIALGTLVRSAGLLLFIMSSIVSYIAAGAIEISVLRYIQYILTISFALLISSRYSIDEVCETFFYTACIIVVAYFLMYPILAGTIDYDPIARATLVGSTAYGGLFPHKSAAAVVFSLSLIVSVARFLGSRDTARRRSSAILTCGLLIAIAMTGAVAALIGLMISLVASILLGALIRGNISRLILFSNALFFVAALIFVLGMDTVLGFFGRTADLTGRQELFELWPTFFWQKPLLGYGFNGFFYNLPGAPGYYLSAMARGHGAFVTFENAYLEILIDFGLVGGLLLGYILIQAAFNAAKFYRSSASIYNAVPLTVMFFVLIVSMSEADVVQQNFIVCALVFWIYFGVDRIRVKGQAGSLFFRSEPRPHAVRGSGALTYLEQQRRVDRAGPTS